MLAEVIPHGSNVYDMAIVVVVAVLGYMQLRLKSAQVVAKDRADRAAVKAEAIKHALPKDQRKVAEQKEHELLDNGVGEEFKKVTGYYP